MRFSTITTGLLVVTAFLSTSARSLANPPAADGFVQQDIATPGSNASAVVQEAQDGKKNASEYKFRFNEFVPHLYDDGGSNRQPYFKVIIFFKKKPNITEVSFHTHWKSVHADMFMSQKGLGVHLMRYSQFHQDEASRKKLLPIMGKGGALAPWDGIAEFHARNEEHWAKFIAGVRANKALMEDELKFIDYSSGLLVMAGYDNVIFGSGISTSNGRNGIMPNDPRLTK
ncbi:hypothetical protein BDV95DRAFT_610389 [Massariosphaeria phaeospora]|uniref:EthD domain-containing protein n=1 Tax=Massariosphaeria phaeospora TaxID=100035 RepID=A0A7C8I131_9PLEO|nr:hypothetical protein BDV95DRAFT_610389 [Massariosphaeria phaeospora]